MMNTNAFMASTEVGLGLTIALTTVSLTLKRFGGFFLQLSQNPFPKRVSRKTISFPQRLQPDKSGVYPQTEAVLSSKTVFIFFLDG